MTEKEEIKFVGAGGAWSQEEEAILYKATLAGQAVAQIADRHGRTVGGIRARQKRMCLREERSGALIHPLPPLQHFAKPDSLRVPPQFAAAKNQGQSVPNRAAVSSQASRCF